MKTNRKTSRVLLFICVCLFIFNSSYSQSETHNFTTYDTLINAGPSFGSITWRLRISRPIGMFGNGPDSASRPLIMFSPGQGEMGTNYAKLQTNGPHYWLNNGWDGGITLGNGLHYPILITVISSNTFFSGREYAEMLNTVLSIYHIKRNSVHISGLSQGGFATSSSIYYERVPGDEFGMKQVSSLLCLQGIDEWPNGYPSTVNKYVGAAWGQWASKYGGKFLGLEGSNDPRSIDVVRDQVNAAVPGNGFLGYENIGGGGHCCWSTMTDPSRTNWKSTAPYGTNMVSGSHATSMGTYQNGDYLFKWMLKQGDTSLVGANMAPIADPGPDVVVIYPQTDATISAANSVDPDGSIVAYSWNKLSGPAQIAMANTNTSDLSISNLALGTYTFQLTVTDDMGASSNSVVSLLSTASVLAINFQNVKGQNIAGVNKVTWDANEDDGIFYVERSLDGKTFQQIADLKATTAAGTKHSYSYIDDNTLAGRTYYRIKNVGTNGSVKYSDIVQIVQQSQRSAISFYPNPVKDFVDIQVNASDKGAVIIRLLDIQGRVVMQQQGVKTKELYIEKMNISKLPNGVFIATCMIGNNQLSLGKIIKN